MLIESEFEVAAPLEEGVEAHAGRAADCTLPARCRTH